MLDLLGFGWDRVVRWVGSDGVEIVYFVMVFRVNLRVSLGRDS